MKSLLISDRLFDPSEIDHCELFGTILYIYYKNSDCVSKVRFDSHEDAMLEYYVLPDYIKKSLRRR